MVACRSVEDASILKPLNENVHAEACKESEGNRNTDPSPARTVQAGATAFLFLKPGNPGMLADAYLGNVSLPSLFYVNKNRSFSIGPSLLLGVAREWKESDPAGKIPTKNSFMALTGIGMNRTLMKPGEFGLQGGLAVHGGTASGKGMASATAGITFLAFTDGTNGYPDPTRPRPAAFAQLMGGIATVGKTMSFPFVFNIGLMIP